MKLFSPKEVKEANQSQIARDLMRTRETTEALHKAEHNLNKSEADFQLMLASQRARWADEEKEHADRLAQMSQEVSELESRKQKALIPIDEIKKKAENTLKEANDRLLEVEKKEEDFDEKVEAFEERLDEVGQREVKVIEEEKRVKMARASIEAQNTLSAETARRTTEQVQSFNILKIQEESKIRKEWREIELARMSLNARAEILDGKEKSQKDERRRLADLAETLQRSAERIKK